MRTWDVTTPAAKLDLAMHNLEDARCDVAERWDDDASRQFQDRFLVQLPGQMRRLLDSIHRLAEVLTKAHRDCDDQSSYS